MSFKVLNKLLKWLVKNDRSPTLVGVNRDRLIDDVWKEATSEGAYIQT